MAQEGRRDAVPRDLLPLRRTLFDVFFGEPCRLAGAEQHPESDLITEVYEYRSTWELLPKIGPFELHKLAQCNFNIIDLDQVLNPDGDSFLGHPQSRENRSAV